MAGQRRATHVPKLKDVANELVVVKLKWKDIGRHLGIVNEEECTHPDWFTDPADFLCEILHFWLEGNTSVSRTWESVLSALESVGEMELSQKLKDKYCKSQPGYENEKKELLKKNLAKIKKSFGNLKQQVLHILKGKDIDMDEFVQFVSGLVPNPDCIEGAEEIATIFRAISRNLLWSYSDYRLLKSIAEEFAVEDTEQLIDHYERELTSFYAVTRLVDYIDLCQDEDVLADPDEPLAPNPAKYNKEHFQKLTIKIGRRVTDETLQYAADLWKEVSKFFGRLPSLVNVLDCILAG